MAKVREGYGPKKDTETLTSKSKVSKGERNKERDIGETLIGKYRAGALYRQLGSLEGIFEKQKDGVLKIVRTLLTEEDKNAKKINEHNITVMLHGDTWRIKDEIKEELQNKLEDYLKSEKANSPCKVKELEMVKELETV